MKLDHDRVRTRLLDIAKALTRLRRFQEMSKGAFLADEDSQDIARSRLLTAIEAALSICYHLTAKQLQRVPEDYAHCFRLLGEANIIDPDLAARLSRMARFRNRLVHLYWDIDYAQVYAIINQDLNDLDEFANSVAKLLSALF